MSRTDKTSPRWVQAQWQDRYLVEAHECNRNGLPCDLGPRELFAGTRCDWQESTEFWATATHSCTYCSDQLGRKQARRRERYAGRREARDAR